MAFFKQNNGLVGLLVVALLVGLYTFFNNIPVSQEDLISITANLAEKPFLGQQGGDMPRNFIRIRLEGDETVYDLIDCAYSSSRDSNILSLDIETPLIVTFRPMDSESRVIELYELSVLDGENLLTLSDYNRCYANRWKMMAPFAVGLFLLLLYKWIRYVRKK